MLGSVGRILRDWAAFSRFEVEGESRSIQMRLQMQMCLKIQTTMRQDNTGDDDDRLGVEEKASATEW